MNVPYDYASTSSHIVPTRVTELFRIELTKDSASHFFATLRKVGDRMGLFIATPRDLEPGTAVLAQIKMNGRTIAARGVVCWSIAARGEVPAGVAVALDDVSLFDRQAIESFCALRPPFYFDLLA